MGSDDLGSSSDFTAFLMGDVSCCMVLTEDLVTRIPF